jgi:hypothetical protein
MIRNGINAPMKSRIPVNWLSMGGGGGMEVTFGECDNCHKFTPVVS